MQEGKRRKALGIEEPRTLFTQVGLQNVKHALPMTPAVAGAGGQVRPAYLIGSPSSSGDVEVASKKRKTNFDNFSSVLDVIISLHVRRTSADGVTQVTRLPLNAISGVGELRGLFRRLIVSAFPDQLPDYLDSPEFYQFTPTQDFVSLPGEGGGRTVFRLVAALKGWDGRGLEVTLAERELGGQPDPERRLLVTMAEFDSEPVALEDGRELVVSLVAYPTVSVHRDFLNAAVKQLAQGAAGAAASLAHSESTENLTEEGDSAGSALTMAP